MDPETPPAVSDPPTPQDLENLRQWSLLRRADLVTQADGAANAVLANERLAAEVRASWVSQHHTPPPLPEARA
jgi:hypothetical protein